MQNRVRACAVAGTFYPADPKTLDHTVEELFSKSQVDTHDPMVMPKALIVPHAGYVYSGPIAASAYTLLKGFISAVSRVIILGPAHRVYVKGLALSEAKSFDTPLGSMPLDVDTINKISTMPQVIFSENAHHDEHSLEVQLPFLRKLSSDIQIVPLLVGDTSPQDVAEVLLELWDGAETVVLVSSDLSHYLPYEAAKKVDYQTAQQILDLKGPLNYDQACGSMPINGLLLAAKKHRLKVRLLDLRNSGDTAGDRSQVVGYSAFSFS